MKRVCLLALIAALCLAQRSRDDYRAAYRAWREADPNLEQEAVEGDAPIGQRADRLAAAAVKFGGARKVFLEDVAEDQAHQVSWLEGAALGPESPAISTTSEAQFVTAETAAVTRTIDTFSSDPDKGIQKLKQALERERATLDALNVAIAERSKPAQAVHALTETIEQARGKALDQSQVMLAGLKDAATGTMHESAAWAEYYRKIGEGAQGPAVPITEVPPGVEAVTVNNPVPAPPTVTPLPLARYVGEWRSPPTDAVFHGAEPDSIAVVIRADQGQAAGTFVGRFKVAPGSNVDPMLRFDFSGDFQSTPNQVFNLVTKEGVKGKVEIIPGSAFNLLEVKFKTEPNPGKLDEADVVLVKQ